MLCKVPVAGEGRKHVDVAEILAPSFELLWSLAALFAKHCLAGRVETDAGEERAALN
jgi:hypothetical protein